MTTFSQTPAPDFEQLLNAAVDGELTDSDETALQLVLRDDSAARRRYLQFMQLHAELHWNHGATAALLVRPEERVVQADRPDRHTAARHSGWMLLAVALGTLAAGWFLAVAYFPERDAGGERGPAASIIASVEFLQGSVSFRPEGGEPLVLYGRGQELTAGALLLEGESSVAQWRFLDGTLVTVSGDAEIRFRDDGQKVLRVRQGVLTAEVQPQPVEAPLVIETATARVDVLGTVFTLAAEPERTRINVAAGRVQVTRLVDGVTVEVARQQRCVASFDARTALQTEVGPDPAVGWQHRFTEPPPERWKGEWLPAEDRLPARVKAVACLVGRKHEADYAPIVHYGVSARRLDGVSLGELPSRGVLRVGFRTQQSARLQIMLGVHRADGGFGGNFEAKLPRDAGTPLADGWRELVVPLEALVPIGQKKRELPLGARPYLILITTYGDDAGLEVAELAIESVTNPAE